MPPDLARKIGVSGINEILDVFWKGYQELKKTVHLLLIPHPKKTI